MGASDDLRDISGDFGRLAELNGVPIVIGKSHSSKHEPKQGSKFAHSVSSGFKWDYRDTVVEAVQSAGSALNDAGLLFQLNLDDDLRGRLGEFEAFAGDIGRTIEIKGRDLMNGVPKELVISERQIAESLAEPISAIIDAVKVALEHTAPELAADIVDRGIVLTGGGALLKNLDQLLREETSLPIIVADDPLTTVALGSGQTLDSIETLKRVIIT